MEIVEIQKALIKRYIQHETDYLNAVNEEKRIKYQDLKNEIINIYTFILKFCKPHEFLLLVENYKAIQRLREAKEGN